MLLGCTIIRNIYKCGRASGLDKTVNSRLPCFVFFPGSTFLGSSANKLIVVDVTLRDFIGKPLYVVSSFISLLLAEMKNVIKDEAE